mgnify:FL=1
MLLLWFKPFPTRIPLLCCSFPQLHLPGILSLQGLLHADQRSELVGGNHNQDIVIDIPLFKRPAEQIQKRMREFKGLLARLEDAKRCECPSPPFQCPCSSVTLPCEPIAVCMPCALSWSRAMQWMSTWKHGSDVKEGNAVSAPSHPISHCSGRERCGGMLEGSSTPKVAPGEENHRVPDGSRENDVCFCPQVWECVYSSCGSAGMHT